ncbi:MAG: (2Fe-2S)-binding protein [Ardenticatenaceae bacterium]|nr:(2Fe-2S)-binding protein [Ardenticatenaceae bacterium]
MTHRGAAPDSPRGHTVTITVDGAPLPALAGQTIAGALLAAGRRSWRHTRRGRPRGLFCGIGLCFDCLVTANGTPNVRACLTVVAEGMVVETNLDEQLSPSIPDLSSHQR